MGLFTAMDRKADCSPSIFASRKKKKTGLLDGGTGSVCVCVGGGGVGWGVGGGPFNTTLTSTWKAAWRNKSLSSSR